MANPISASLAWGPTGCNCKFGMELVWQFSEYSNEASDFGFFFEKIPWDLKSARGLMTNVRLECVSLGPYLN